MKKQEFNRQKYNKIFIKKSKKIHKNKYNYSKFIYINARKDGIIICPSHGEFTQRPDNHLQGKGCSKCRDELSALRFKSNQTEFKNKSNKIHKNKYDYSKFIYINAHTKSNIICKEHGCFLQTANQHLGGKGCPKCGRLKIENSRRLTIKNVLSKFKKIHKNKYDYSLIKEYKNERIRLPIICKKHGVFLQSSVVHLNGSECPRCRSMISKFEKEFLDYLKIPNNPVNRQVCIFRKRVDGLLNNTIYEYLGDYWHGNPNKFHPMDINQWTKKSFGELYKQTILRLDQLKNIGYKINYIWESDWKKFKDGIDKIPNIIEY